MLPLLMRAILPFFETPGGAGGGGTAPPAAPAAPPAAPAAAPAAQPAPNGGAPAAEPKMFSLEYVRELRDEAKGWREKYQGERDAWKALGADPAAVKATVDGLHGTVRTLKVDGALASVVAKHSVDPELTRAVLASNPEFAKLNPDDPEFGKSLDNIVKQAAEKHPALKAGATPPAPPAPPRSGLPITGGGQQGASQLTREQLKAMTPEQVAEAYRKGELSDVLKGAR